MTMQLAFERTQPARAAAPLLELTDFCKGAAIAWVFLFHYQYATGLTWFSWAGWQGVHIFVVLSGFGLTYSLLKKNGSPDWRQWLRKRTGRILPGFWLVAGLGLAVAVLVELIAGTGGRTGIDRALHQTVLDLFLLRNFSHQTITPTLNVSLWFVPFVLGLYLLFPALFGLVARTRSVKQGLGLLGVLLIAECAYRAFAIYGCNGWPIAYGVLALPTAPLVNPDLGPFQLQAPFGMPLSRLAEFGLGMLGALALVRNPNATQRFVFNPWTAGAGFAIWALGTALVYTGPAGWIVSDFVIALGLVVAILNFGRAIERALPRCFAAVSRLGVCSYPVFLCHAIFVYLCQTLERQWLESFPVGSVGMPGVTVLTLCATLALTAGVSRLLLRVESRALHPQGLPHR